MKAISINAYEIENDDGETMVFMTPKEFDFIKKQNDLKNKENERLNNIINELEKDIIEKINDIKNNYSQVNGNYFNMNCVIDTYENVLDKLQELKGSDKE